MIRKATVDDILSIVDMENKVFKETLGEKFLYQEMTMNPYAYYYVFELGKQVIGYIGYRVDLEFAEMMNFCVTPTHQSEGYGTNLLTSSLNEIIKLGAKSIILEVRKSNVRAQHVYEKLGFKASHTKPNYYKKEDAIVYLKEV